jgi:hypothetical protein
MKTLSANSEVPVVPAVQQGHDGRMKRLALAAAIAVTLPLLSACSGGGDAPGATDAPRDDTATAAPTIDIEGGDAFCDLAVAQIPIAEDIEAKSADIQTLVPQLVTGGGLDELHQWGDDMAGLTTTVVAFYDEATPMVDDPAAQQSFVDMRAFVNDYSLGLARIAQAAATSADFVTQMAEFTQEPGVQEAMTRGPGAAQEVRAYIDERCGSLT